MDVERGTVKNGDGDGQHTTEHEGGNCPKRWQCHTGNAAISVTPHAISDRKPS